jgi:hypothetical protein
MEFVALTHQCCFLFFLPIGYSSRILHLSLIVARTRPPPHPTRTRTAAGIHPSHACHCLSVLPDCGHFVFVAFVAAPSSSSSILLSPPSLSWARCSTLCGLILPASKFPCRCPTNDSSSPPLSVLVADYCVFLCFFPITQLPEEWRCFLRPPSPLLQSHSLIMVSANDAWSLPPPIPAPSSLGRSGRPPRLIIVDFSWHPPKSTKMKISAVVQKIPRHRSGRCSSLISQNGGSID